MKIDKKLVERVVNDSQRSNKSYKNMIALSYSKHSS